MANSKKIQKNKLRSPFFIGDAIQGISHKKTNTPCQDSYQIKCSSNSFFVGASDGVGSEEASHIGAQEASKVSVNMMKGFMKNAGPYIDTPTITKILKKSVVYARNTLVKKSIKDGKSLNSYACTLMLVFGLMGPNGFSVHIAHIGDGAVVGSVNDKLTLLSEPRNGEYVNYVTPLTHRSFQEHLRFRSYENVNNIAIFTDGCQRAALTKNDKTYTPYEGFFANFFSYFNELKKYDHGKKELTALLKNKIAKTSDDDLTLIVGVL